MADKSKKDLAFDRERNKYKKEIKKLQSEISTKNKEISDLKIKLSELEVKVQEKDDHINRLLEYMDMSSEEYEQAINSNKIASHISETLTHMNHISNMFGCTFKGV